MAGTEANPSVAVEEVEAEAPEVEAEEPTNERAAPPCDAYPLATRIEAILLSTDRPLTEAKLVSLLGLARDQAADVKAALAELGQQYDDTSRAARIEKLAGGWQILTRPEFGPLLERVHKDRSHNRLSPAALETLSIISYRQPILRAEIEAIRGVAAGEVLRGLLERRLVKIVGRAEELGRPMLYGTTKEFLRVFGLGDLKDLPEVEGLERSKRRRPRVAPVEDASADDVTAEDASDVETSPEIEAAVDPAAETPDAS